MPKVKKFLPGTAIIVSSYFSILFAIGLIIGYFVTKYFYNGIVKKEKLKIKPIFLNFGKKQIHLHHWLMGTLAFLLIWLFGWLSSFPIIFIGAIFGLVWHDLYFDKNWYKIVLKKQKIEGP